MKNKKPILCLDFDGVIHSYTSGWKGANHIPDPPVNGALKFIAEATDYFNVNIFSSRTHQKGGRKAMRNWLMEKYMQIGGVKRTGYPSPFRQFNYIADILEPPKWYYKYILNDTHMEPWGYEVYDGVKKFLKQINFPKHKPSAMITIDDRALCFTGFWPEIEELENFKPWNKI